MIRTKTAGPEAGGILIDTSKIKSTAGNGRKEKLMKIRKKGGSFDASDTR